MSLGQIDEALEEFGHALESAQDAAQQAQIRGAIASACQTRAGSLQASDVSAAIAVIERGLALSKDDSKLKATLAELLTQRAVQNANEAQRKLGGSPDAAALKGVKNALSAAKKDLDRAVGLGSERAKQNLESVANLLAGLESGLLGLPAAVAGPLQRAQELAAAGNLDAAIEAAREAKSAARADAASAVGKLLAQLLNARGVQKLDQAMRDARPAAQVDPQKAVMAFLMNKPLEDADPFGLGSPLGTPKPSVGEQIVGFVKENWFWPVWILGCGLAGSDQASTPLRILGGIVMMIPMVLPLILSFFESISKAMTASIPPMYGGGRPSVDCMVKGCSSDARYELTPPGFPAPLQLCSSHADGLKKRLSGAPKLSPNGMLGLAQANQDIGEAARLDPSNSTVSQNLAQVRQVIEAVGRGL